MTAPTAPTAPTRRRARRAAVGVLVALSALVLAACGTDVTTTMSIGTGNQGSRAITLTLDSSSLDQYVQGGAAALDASIVKHKPSQIDYSGISTTTTGISTTFTIPFTSADDYRARVAALLTAGGSTITPQITLSATDSLFTQGAAIDENFTSKDLLAWLVTGLVDDGVITSGDSTSFWNSDNDSVVYAGQTTSVSSPISFQQMQDDGVTAVTMLTTVQADGTYARTITYAMDASAYATNPTGFGDYFTKATPQGGTMSPVTTSDGMASWSIHLPAGSASRVASMTDQALGSSATQFSFDAAPASSAPTLIDDTLVDSAECSAICSPRAAPIQSTVVVPSDWQPISGTYTTGDLQSTTATFGHTADGSPIVFEHPVPLRSVTVDTVVSSSKAVTTTFTFTAANADVDRAGDGFQQVLKPAGTVGGFTTNRGPDATTYVVVISGSDANAFDAKLREYVPGSDFILGKAEGNGFFHDHYYAYLELDLASTLTGSGVTDGYTYTFTAPGMHRATLVGPGGAAARTITTTSQAETQSLEYDVSGLPTGALIFWCVLAGVVLLLIVAGLLLRRRIGRAIDDLAQRVQASRARADERRATSAGPDPTNPEQSATIPAVVPVAGWPTAPPAAPVAEAAPVADAPAWEFSEADLI